MPKLLPAHHSRSRAPVATFEAWLDRRQASADPAAAGSKGERTRARLLLAAARQLGEQGYAGLSIADVCAAAGVTRTALYKHFPTKQDLVLALVSDFQQFLGDALRDGGRRGAAGADDPVLATNLAYVRLYRKHARLVHAVQEARQALDDAERLKFEMNERWARKVAMAMQAGAAERPGESRDANSREALVKAYALEAMVDGFLAEWILRRNPHLAALRLSDVDVARLLTDAWHGVLRG
jgi:AcrR family transcriptional regulator